MNIVIEVGEDGKFKLYEDGTQTLLISESLSDGLCNMNLYLKSEGVIPQGSDLFRTPGIKFHLDSGTMNQIFQSNVDLLMRLRSTSEFKTSTEKFVGGGLDKKKTEFSHGSKTLTRSKFGGKSSFNQTNKKWGK